MGTTTRWTGAGWALALLAGCGGGGEGAPTATPPPPPPMPPVGGGCDMDAVLAAEGCTNAGCHGVQHVGGLDLASPGVAARLVGVPSVTDACEGTPLVDRDDPSSSLLLALVDPSRTAPCGVPMPFGADGVAPDQVACFEGWVEALVAEAPAPTPPPVDFEPTDAESMVAKVKALATGEAVTAEELDVVRTEGPAGLQRLLDDWMARPAFAAKMQGFLEVALQQRLKGPLQLQLGLGGLRAIGPSLQASFVRTAWALIERGEPFTRIATTRRWAVTTAILSALRFTDQPFDRRASLAAAPLEPQDFEDWRFVELLDARPGEALIDYRDVEALRGVSSRIALELPRVGFFSTPAFLANAETNEDNQFRVTTNQALIVALGRDFDVADPTVPPTTAGLDLEHSDPETPCYGCHKLLDPMRLYFQGHYDYRYRRNPRGGAEVAGFGFLGATTTDPTLDGFGRALADHPRFALAWTEKLCQWAVSRVCDPSDPELTRIAEAFRASGHDFRVLARELLASPLVTGSAPTRTHEGQPFLVSVTRQSHLCRLLDARLGTSGVCAERAVGAVLGLVPDDDFGRGKEDLVQTAGTSAFHFAGAEQVCARVGALIALGAIDVDFTFAADAPQATARDLVEHLMGLPPNHSRHDRAVAVLERHLLDAEGTPGERLRSAFVLACLSPDVMAVGL